MNNGKSLNSYYWVIERYDAKVGFEICGSAIDIDICRSAGLQGAANQGNWVMGKNFAIGVAGKDGGAREAHRTQSSARQSTDDACQMQGCWGMDVVSEGP